ncbi:DNA ligase D [Aromatoleum bremense]|uniref:DNA ligase (ATP) n=1 Tax=Aromatoleum bremense TaxID=76115 RepID=A0ABX1NUS0_9RHOO|nr:DNA ligase D [Aromatoleum bremense]NMG15397.1 DNA ligase D [Aromatoleum bremense]QTQ34067.1 Multifunctional non-homologous end joining protein [Aromatoleum bremense]
MKRSESDKDRAGDPLARYRAMRDFGTTPEPGGDTVAVKAGGGPTFTVQRHAARRLHYDFRLELDGVLKSWAVPKGPSLNPSERRLAVETEDHPLDYGDFEGVIPAKQYGAGDVVLWDRGHWSTDSPDVGADLARGKLKFHLDGEKLNGGWTLVRMRARAGEEDSESHHNWLLIKEDDDEARVGDEAEITLTRPGSVKHVDERAGRREAGTTKAASTSAESRRTRKAPRAGAPAAEGKTAKRRDAALPAFVTPQLATLVDEPPSGEGWVYEIKYDGYRVMARLQAGTVTLYTRTGQDWTHRMPQLAKALAALKLDDSWLDGEIVVNGDNGLPDFQALQNVFEQGSSGRIVYYVFDAPWLSGDELAPLPLAERKRRLAAALASGEGGAIVYSEHFAGDVGAALEQACRLGLEGLIGKRGDARYVSGRSRSWIKLKCRPRQEFVIGGYTDPGGAREGFGALLVGLYDDAGALNYAGKVGTGFDRATLDRLARQLAALARKDSPFARKPRGAGQHWVRPTLVAEVEYAGWTRDNLLRQAAFAGLREDKPANTVQDEIPLSPEVAAQAEQPPSRAKSPRRQKKKPSMERSGPAKPRASSESGEVRVTGIVITHPERVVWPDAGLTKADLAHYYEDIAPWLLPHVVSRPLSLLRCPDGSEAECFFQRHMGQERPGGVESFIWEASAKDRRSYLYVTDLEGVIGMVQRGVVEFHTWGSTMPRADRPDRITIDLDPGPELAWERVAEAAQLVRGLLGELGLASFLKTTGGKGLHVVVPLRRGPQWGDVKRFAKAVATHLARILPDRFTANMAKNRRAGRIFVDYLRNEAGASAICAYAARARPGAPVSTPLAWDELGPELKPGAFTILTVADRLARLREDPWRDYAKQRFMLTHKMWEALGETPP